MPPEQTSPRPSPQDAPPSPDPAARILAATTLGAHEEAHSEAGKGHSGDDHQHEHEHGPEDLRELARTNRKRLLFVLVSGSLVMTSEVIGGIAANSLVLLADAGHYLTDILAVALAYLAVSWAMRPATMQKTFGYHRAEVVAAFVNALALWGISAYFLWEAYQRILDPPAVGGTIVMVVGGVSLVANVFLAWLLHRGAAHNINVRAAYVHIISDVLGSAAALLTGFLVRFYGVHIADPVLTLFITALILAFTWRLTRQTLHILLEGHPAHISPQEVADALRAVPSVKDFHDLHVWSLTSGVESLSVHVVLDRPPSDDRVSHEVHRSLKQRFRIDHVTVQVESPDCPCDVAHHPWPAR